MKKKTGGELDTKVIQSDMECKKKGYYRQDLLCSLKSWKNWGIWSKQQKASNNESNGNWVDQWIEKPRGHSSK